MAPALQQIIPAVNGFEILLGAPDRAITTCRLTVYQEFKGTMHANEEYIVLDKSSDEQF